MSARFDGLIALAVLLGAWQGLYLLVGAGGLASPAATLAAAGSLLAGGFFWQNAAATGEAFLWAAVITVAGGLALGLVLGLWRFAGEVAAPILSTLYAIPKVTLYPVILLLFGLGLPAKVAFGVLHGIFPLMLLTMSGVRAVNPVVLKTARALRLGPWATIISVLLPAALPEIFTGLRIGIVLAMFGALIGELFAADRGLGYLLMRGVERGEVPQTMALSLLLFAFAVASGIVLLAIDRRLRHAPRAD